MYSDSFLLVQRLLPLVAIAVGGEFCIQLLQELLPTTNGMAFASVLVWSYLAYGAHAELLLPDSRDKTEDNKRVLGFALRTFGLGVLIFVPAIVFAFVILSATAINPDDEAIYGLTLIVIGIAAAIGFLIIFSLFGTMLPAYVLDRGRGMSAALARGVSQFLWITGKLLIGPLFLYTFSVVVVIIGLSFIAPHPDLLGENNMPNIAAITVLIIGYLIQAVGTVMVAWILSTAYVLGEEAME